MSSHFPAMIPAVGVQVGDHVVGPNGSIYRVGAYRHDRDVRWTNLTIDDRVIWDVLDEVKVLVIFRENEDEDDV